MGIEEKKTVGFIYAYLMFKRNFAEFIIMNKRLIRILGLMFL